MKQFYNIFSDTKVATLSQLLTWSHYVELLPLDDNNEKTRLNLIDNGYCLTVCNCVSFLEDEPFYNDVEYYLLDDGGTSYHFFMKYDDLYYDAYNYKGVKKLSDLQFCKIYMKGKSDDYLNKYLILVGKGDDFTYEKAQSYIK